MNGTSDKFSFTEKVCLPLNVVSKLEFFIGFSAQFLFV